MTNQAASARAYLKSPGPSLQPLRNQNIFRLNSEKSLFQNETKPGRLNGQIIANFEYDKFRPVQDRAMVGDFDKAISKLKPPRPKRREKS